MSHTIYCFNHSDLSTIRACFANPNVAIGNGAVDASGQLRYFAHDWETINPTAHAALLATGKVRTYSTMAELRAVEPWVEWVLQ